MKIIPISFSIRIGAKLEHLFGVAKVSYQERLGRWSIRYAIMLVVVLAWLLMPWLQGMTRWGCFWFFCSFGPLSSSSFFELCIAIIALWVSTAISISQQEQSDTIAGITQARQSFNEKFSNQLILLDQYFSEIPDSSKLEMEIYVSSPLFGILDGSEALHHYNNIIDRFVETALTRARREEDSSLYMYIWKDHAKHFGKKCEMPMWKAEGEERKGISHEIARFVASMKLIHEQNIKPETEENEQLPAKCNKIGVYLFEVERSVCRFFHLNTGPTKRTAMITMAPIGNDNVLDLQSILILDNTDAGMALIKRFSEGFTRRDMSDPNVMAKARNSGAGMCADPSDYLNKAFDCDLTATMAENSDSGTASTGPKMPSRKRVTKGNAGNQPAEGIKAATDGSQ